MFGIDAKAKSARISCRLDRRLCVSYDGQALRSTFRETAAKFVTILLNGENRELERPVAVAELIALLHLKPEHVAVEVNGELISRGFHGQKVIHQGDVLEVVTLVGGGSPTVPEIPRLTIGGHSIESRLLVGTGKYATLN